jgi:hypothetical protein
LSRLGDGDRERDSFGAQNVKEAVEKRRRLNDGVDEKEAAT